MLTYEGMQTEHYLICEIAEHIERAKNYRSTLLQPKHIDLYQPVILEQPYFSSIATLDEWVEALEAGLIAWKKAHAEIHAEPDSNRKIKARL